jgi:hypothetical protein
MSPGGIQHLDRENSRQGKNNSDKGNRTQHIDKTKNHIKTRQKNKVLLTSMRGVAEAWLNDERS